ncbi:MAG: hydroxyisourate hydrolase [Gemmatimonadetes bacterium]|nr:hydroxyisourate hydrolase [Gemmatimonadota bacterium]
MSSLSTHVLDVSVGRPAVGVAVSLLQEGRLLGGGTTDADGRLKGFVAGSLLAAGTYSLRFDTGSYFGGLGRECFYPEVVVTFSVGAEGHYHVPLLLAAYGYSTYRGS